MSLVMGFRQARALQKPYTSGGTGANACPDPPCPGRGWRLRSGREGAKGRRGTAAARRSPPARPPGAARHVGAADGEGRGALPCGRRPFSPLLPPSRFTGSSSGAAAVGARRVPLSPPCLRGGWCLGPPRPAPTPPPGNTLASVSAAGCAAPRKTPSKADGEAPPPGSGSGSRTGGAPGPRAGDARRRRGQRGPGPPGRVPSGDLQETAPTAPSSAGETGCPFILLDV